ncbi:MAG: Uma2 family endonuclease [Chloroflexi bacterium]|nr:Uma2 family endonuclease [Chloroflexota bacterium]
MLTRQAAPVTHVAQTPLHIPHLENGDHLTRGEFERRYSQTAEKFKAELIEGVVYVPSPARVKAHANPHSTIIGLLFNYAVATPGTQVGDNGTVRLDADNEVQPDAFLRIEEKYGGQSRLSADDYIEGAPELIVEIAASSASYDLYEKFNVYRRVGVREYIVWRTEDKALDWFRLQEGKYERVLPDAAGILRSAIFPGLNLAAQAVLEDRLSDVLAELQKGIGSPEHQQFAEKLAKGK